MPPDRDIIHIASLDEEHRILWIRTILAMSNTEPQRRAFIDGYNGYAEPRGSRGKMLENHALGKRVSRLLNGDRK